MKYQLSNQNQEFWKARYVEIREKSMWGEADFFREAFRRMGYLLIVNKDKSITIKEAE